ncbi:hypothetical protein [Actinopolymorpha pittospori]|uniref:Uncharacterized protein n=1 Tax=Actinopolymorpha pittospori TaxID=648752 RepID=A0A927N089_9ACTN|nr:hypothetical protein [Actinopolymorpha pittospori]MBE1609866.1 hypothetical protein [Actinopolymorpha pittospori]
MTVRTVRCVEITCDVCGSPIDEYGAHYDSVDEAADAAADGDWSVSPDRASWVCPDCPRRPGGAS